MYISYFIIWFPQQNILNPQPKDPVIMQFREINTLFYKWYKTHTHWVKFKSSNVNKLGGACD
jgi:hypothetical protein